MVADRAKKSRTVAAEGDDQFERDEVLLSIEKLQEVQDELEKVNEEANEKVLEVEQKYNEMRKPVYVKRNEIITSIPDFWFTAFVSHPALADLLSEEDHEIFKYLDSLNVEDFKDFKMGYCITFNFRPNPFFEDTKLTKTINFSDEGTLRVTGTTIKWKEGKGPFDGSSDGEKGNKRPLSKQSFFSWFSDNQPQDTSELEQDEVAELIKEDLWPNPIKYFNNEDDEEDSEEDEGEDDEDEENVDDKHGNEEEDD
ncbi:hypothetical protein Pfo_019603 [Paulownia fortunei]|nr:hypothetical protein Pfo_019603 [Paulownia fortunei]